MTEKGGKGKPGLDLRLDTILSHGEVEGLNLRGLIHCGFTSEALL